MMEIEKPKITCEETDNGKFAKLLITFAKNRVHFVRHRRYITPTNIQNKFCYGEI